MDYKKYYTEIKEKLSEFSEVVYYEPLTEDEILVMEKQIGQKIKTLYREYLLNIGLIQDVFDELEYNGDSFFEDFNFIKGSLKDFLPISSGIDIEEDTIYLINNNDPQDDFVYSVKIDDDNKFGQIKKLKPFPRIIEESISRLKENYKNRCHNRDKINNVEFIISGNDFPDFIEIFETEGLKQKSDWKPKYYQENVFGDEVAIFELFNNEIIIQRNEDYSKYSFELEEPILTPIEKSMIKKAFKLLNVQRIKFDKIECRPIEK